MRHSGWEGEMDAEMRFHLESLIKDFVARGYSRAEAERMARQQFGSFALAQEECRDTRPFEWLRSIGKDFEIALRNIHRAPGFSLAVIATLALGIGANTTVLSVANAWLLRSLPYANSDRLVAVYERRPHEAHMERNFVSYPDFIDWRTQNSVFEAMGAYLGADFIYSSGPQAERVSAALVTHEVLPVLGVHAKLGRDFNAGDETASRSTAVIVSDAFWRRSLGGDPSAVGQALLLSGRSYTIAGVLPANFVPPVRAWEIFIPMEVDPVFRRLRSAHGLLVIARRKPGVSLDQAKENMDVISKRLEREYSDNQGHYANVVPLADALRDQFRPAALALLGAAMLVLLIACFNVANLMLARAMARAREIGTRLALGAARSRIARHFLVESFVFALAGALLGTAIAWGAVFLLRSLLPPNPSILPADVRVDRLNLVAAAGLAFLTSLICGTIPAFRAARASLGDIIRAGERQQTASPGQSWSRSAFVISETALALVLLIGAGLLLRSFWKLQSVNPGFRPEKLLTLQLVLPPAYGTDDKIIAFQERMREATRSLPGVLSAGFTSFLPLTGQNMRRGLEIEGAAYQGREPRRGNVRVVSPGYLEAMQIPVVRGRACRSQDIQHAPATALINQTAARMYWEGREPLGTRARLAGMGDWATVVGVSGDVKHFGLEEGARPEIYLCSYQVPAMMNMVVRTEREPEALISAVRLTLREIDREIPPFELRSMEDVMAEVGSQRRFLTLLVAVFAAVALALAAGGIYAQLAYWVARRTSEIGVRIALGARPGQVMGLVLREGLALAGGGLAIGLAIALGLAGMIEKLLFGVAPLDTPTLAVALLLLLTIAGLACVPPAWRASRADPATTLRHD